MNRVEGSDRFHRKRSGCAGQHRIRNGGYFAPALELPKSAQCRSLQISTQSSFEPGSQNRAGGFAKGQRRGKAPSLSLDGSLGALVFVEHCRDECAALDVAKDRAAGLQDVQHALLNLNEFLLRH